MAARPDVEAGQPTDPEQDLGRPPAGEPFVSAPADVVLRDGSTVRLRPVRPADADGLRELFEGLSVESRWRRFFSAGAELEGVARRVASAGERGAARLVDELRPS